MLVSLEIIVFDFLSDKCSNIGNTNAAVFPVPVCAKPKISLPCKAIGIDCFWISVGSVKPASSIPDRILSFNFKSWNFRINPY